MNSLEQKLRGSVVLEFISAAPERCLNRLTEENIPFRDVRYLDELRFQICVPYQKSAAVCALAEKLQAEISIVREHPGIWYLANWIRRPFLLLALTVAVLSVLVLPDYVWIITVSGNETIPDAEIVRALEELGVYFGVKNESIHSQDIKNRLLNAVDGLQWAAVNCSGGHCQVLVKERETRPTLLDRTLAADVVASAPGTITEMRVLAGQAVCRPGDTVEAGDLLVSGLTDWVIDLQKSHAEAEIYALTWHSLQAVIPIQHTVQVNSAETSVCRYLQLGRFRIKISGNSRICGPGCAKIITREILTLPGGYTFPIAWITETCTSGPVESRTMTEAEAEALLCAFGISRTESAMIAGTILSEEHRLSRTDGCFTIDAVYACREMIAREQEVNLFGSEQIYGRTNPERGAD